MPKIKVKNYDGEYDIHENVEKVWYSSADEDGVLVPYSYGEAVDLVDDNAVELDFTEGNQTITADDGTLVRSLEIKKPADLKPENIASGVTIAGVEGTFAGGGGGEGIVLDECLRYFSYTIDDENKEILLHTYLDTTKYNATGSYDISIPNTISGYQVIINANGVIR